MKILGVIPARFSSTRFPGKPLIDIGGKTMIQRVYEQALKARCLEKVVVATDDDRIAKVVEEFGGNVIMTSTTHKSGTDRCAEVAKVYRNYDAIINIQGDEPFIHPEQINYVGHCFRDEETQIATLVKKITSNDELFNENVPKVVVGNRKALYFSRWPIPYIRDIEDDLWLSNHTYFKHIGIYGYKWDVLIKIARMAPSSLETAESLEQLRWLENGYSVTVDETPFESIAIDTPEDLIKVESLI